MSMLVTGAVPGTATTITNTTAYSGNFIAFQVLTDTVFTALAGMSLGSGSTFAGATYPKGALIWGTYTGCTLASGSITVYAQPTS